ncbi:MAG: alpha-amylase family glycosyl hydrolase [Deltaproteobacteria bacterium]
MKLFVNKDPYLAPYRNNIVSLLSRIAEKESQLCRGKNLNDFANAHHYYGLHLTENNWIYRDKLPNADEVYLTGDFSNWEIKDDYKLSKDENGDFTGIFPKDQIRHGDRYRLLVKWGDNSDFRVPAYARRAIQEEDSKVFNAQVWEPDDVYEFKHKSPAIKNNLLVYEAHIGMSSEEPKVSSFNEFRENILPKIKKAGYDTIQLMAIQEHPYYGSFGYHVSGFFAVSSRFGTPEELKLLIDEAHRLGLRVIMDIVHSHAVKNTVEGPGLYDGSDYLYFHSGPRGDHPAWDSRCFNYSKHETLHFLLSNCKFWLEEYRFDGFRFDGVTSMLYLNHGLESNFTNYGMYFDENRDDDAIIYLSLANKLIKQVNPDAVTIAEEMSGMPGTATPLEEGGIGFDFRLAMGVPDYWIKLIKEKNDEDWHVGDIFYELTNKRVDEKVISYCESHDQALVGDKTLIFRLADKDMYFNMDIDMLNLTVNRAIALHKMIRLLTLSTAGNGYLNFMGNEFGHPEWIDFPRSGNDWSYHYARRQWNLAKNKRLAYYYLNEFDHDMISMVKKHKMFREEYPFAIDRNISDQVLIFRRNGLIFVFNFNPTHSFTDYGFEAEKGKYTLVLNSDSPKYLGHNRIDEKLEYYTVYEPATKKHYLKVYAVNRAVLVFRKVG